MGTRETHLGHRVVKQEERESQTTPTSDTTSDSIGDYSYYEVRLLNDIYTPTPLGIQILQGTFSVSYVAAVNMMLSAETTGACSCGIYRRAAAQILIREVMERARKHHAYAVWRYPVGVRRRSNSSASGWADLTGCCGRRFGRQ
jgi:ATP-dependent Clp protease adapter protein ClpS